jgi:hypothetical protein
MAISPKEARRKREEMYKLDEWEKQIDEKVSSSFPGSRDEWRFDVGAAHFEVRERLVTIYRAVGWDARLSQEGGNDPSGTPRFLILKERVETVRGAKD